MSIFFYRYRLLYPDTDISNSLMMDIWEFLKEFQNSLKILYIRFQITGVKSVSYILKIKT